MRLVEGTNSFEGRVEICRSSSWYTVCDVGWDNRDARVVCRQLGFSIAGMSSKYQRSIPSSILHFFKDLRPYLMPSLVRVQDY